MMKCFDSGSNVHIALLQTRTTLLGQELPSPAMLLFNCPIRGIMPVMDRLPVNTDNDDEHHKAVVNRQCRNEQGKDTSKNFVSLTVGSTVMVQWEDRGPWTHGTIEVKDNDNHHDRSYKICITKTGKIITNNRWHIRPTPISAEQYFHNQLVQHPPPPAITDTTNERPHSSNTTLEHSTKQCTKQ